MNFFLMLSLAFCLISSFVVVNGLFGSKKEYPKYHVAIRMAGFNSPSCAGVVVGDKWIATHQSCVLDASQISLLEAVAGVSVVEKAKKDNIVHFEDIKSNGDIALVKTKESLTSAGATTISLPSASLRSPHGVISEFVGTKTGTLTETEASVVGNEGCPGIKESTQFCVGNVKLQKDNFCPGEQGGPFVVDQVVYGIRTNICGPTGSYTDVFKSVQWIKQTIA